MRKVYLIIAVALLLIQSCGKMEDNQNDCAISNNRLIPLETNAKEAGYLLVITIGHLASDCGGRCVTINGIQCHVDCMGNGNVCRQTAAVVLNQTGSSISATTTDTFGLTSQDFFLMPARSLHYTDSSNNYLFLNIPGQLLFRDTTTQQFTFTGLSLTSKPAYTNN